jgi:hypothetical protein
MASPELYRRLGIAVPKAVIEAAATSKVSKTSQTAAVDSSQTTSSAGGHDGGGASDVQADAPSSSTEEGDPNGEATADGGDSSGDDQGGEGEPAAEEPEVFTAEVVEQRVADAIAEKEAAWNEEKSQLESELAEARAAAEGKAVQVVPREINPLQLSDSPAAIDRRAQEVAEAKEWCLKHWDGYEGEGDKDPSYSPEQVRETFARLDREERILPKIRENIAVRQQHEAQAKDVYPALFDKKSEEFKTVQQVLKVAPWIKAVFPNYMMFFGDALAGEATRVAAAKAKGVGKAKPAAGVKPVVGGAKVAGSAAGGTPAARGGKAPVVSTGAASSAKGVITAKKAAGGPGISEGMKNFVKGGGRAKDLPALIAASSTMVTQDDGE